MRVWSCVGPIDCRVDVRSASLTASTGSPIPISPRVDPSTREIYTQKSLLDALQSSTVLTTTSFVICNTTLIAVIHLKETYKLAKELGQELIEN